MTLAGCTPEITCVDVGCTQGFTCDVESGACVEIVSDCRAENTCRPAEICDAATGQCRPVEVKCADGNPCPGGLICDGQTGVCKPAFRCTVDGCSTAELCDSRTERCVPKPCAEDKDCPDTHVCEGSVCRFGCRPSLSTCPPGQSCLFQTGDNAGLCRPNCAQDTDCPFGQRCALTAGFSSCELEGACDSPLDCRPDETCTGGACIQPPCSTNEDCLPTQICEIPVGACLNVSCDEDIYAEVLPNHSRASAFALAPASECPNTATPACVYDDLTLCPQTSDWFSVRAGSTDVVRVRIEQSSDIPDVDLYVWGADGTLLAQNTLLDPISTVRVAPNRDQILFIEIRPTTYTTSTYALSIAREFCANDAFEENDTPSDATAVATADNTPSEIRAKTCGLDEDWFVLGNLSAQNGLRVARTLSDTSLVVQVLSPDGEVLEIARGQEREWPRIGVAGDYYFRVLSALGLSSDYRLGYTVLTQWECPNAGTYNTPATSAQSTQGSAVYGLCPINDGWDVVFVELNGVTAGNLSVTVVPGPDAPSLDISLLVDGTTPVRTAVWTGGAWEITAPVGAGRYLVRVASNQPVERIETDPDFELSWAIQE